MADASMGRGGEGEEEEAAPVEPMRTPSGKPFKLRNYYAFDPSLKACIVKAPVPPSEQLDKKLKDEDAADDKAASDEPLNIAPKKPNWDLKRDVQKKLDILNLRTQRAIADLLRERIANESGTASTDAAEGLADAVNRADYNTEDLD